MVASCWQYFKKTNQHRASCTKCTSTLSYKKGTENLENHLKKKHGIGFVGGKIHISSRPPSTPAAPTQMPQGLQERPAPSANIRRPRFNLIGTPYGEKLKKTAVRHPEETQIETNEDAKIRLLHLTETPAQKTNPGMNTNNGTESGRPLMTVPPSQRSSTSPEANVQNEVKCIRCDEAVKAQMRLRHVFLKHVFENTIKCAYCKFGHAFDIHIVGRHIRKAHPDKKLFMIDNRQKHAPLIKQCFPTLPPVAFGPMKKLDATHPGLIAVKQEMNKAAAPAINIAGATAPTPTETDKTHKQKVLQHETGNTIAAATNAANVLASSTSNEDNRFQIAGAAHEERVNDAHAGNIDIPEANPRDNAQQNSLDQNAIYSKIAAGRMLSSGNWAPLVPSELRERMTTSGEEMTVIMLPTLVPRSVAKEIATLFSKHQ